MSDDVHNGFQRFDNHEGAAEALCLSNERIRALMEFATDTSIQKKKETGRSRQIEEMAVDVLGSSTSRSVLATRKLIVMINSDQISDFLSSRTRSISIVPKS